MDEVRIATSRWRGDLTEITRCQASALSVVGMSPFRVPSAGVQCGRPMKTLSYIDETAFSDAFADIVGALRHFSNWFFLAVTAVRLRYRRSILGPLWISLTTAIFIFIIGYLYSGLTATRFNGYLLNLALGWVLWHFIADSLLQGAHTFQQASRAIHNTNIHKFAFVLKTVLTNLIVFGNALLIPLLVFAVTGVHFSAATLLVIPALVLIILSAVWASTILGLICARYRDLYPLLQAGVRVLFLVTPILWSPSMLPPHSTRRLVADLNPLAHYIAIWRKPLMGEYPDPLSWLVTSGCTLVGLSTAFIVFALYRRRLVFWV
jgi:ABC-2 type transport system permease protein